jgi:hypothetical protein
MGRPAAPIGTTKVDPKGYVHRKVPDHPLANNGCWVREHRRVLFDAIGPGRHRCYYHDHVVEWGVDLHVDHLNRDRQDNRLENLVPACVGGNNDNKSEYRRQWCGPKWNRDTPLKYWLRCVVCGGKFGSDRRHSKTGSDRCRKRLSRRR